MARNDVYMVDCQCVKRYFQQLKDAKEHNDNHHQGKRNIYYNAPYGKAVVVKTK